MTWSLRETFQIPVQIRFAPLMRLWHYYHLFIFSFYLEVNGSLSPYVTSRLLVFWPRVKSPDCVVKVETCQGISRPASGALPTPWDQKQSLSPSIKQLVEVLSVLYVLVLRFPQKEEERRVCIKQNHMTFLFFSKLKAGFGEVPRDSRSLTRGPVLSSFFLCIFHSFFV